MRMRDAVIHVLAVIRLMFLDTKALGYLNTEKGFIKTSLFIPIIFTGIQCLIMPHYVTGKAAELFTDQVWVFYFFAATIGWISFLLLVQKVTRLIDRTESFYRFVIAYCWSIPLQFVVLMPSFIYQAQVPEDSMLKSIILSLTMTFSYVLQWGIAKTTLKLTAISAVGVVILSDIISDFIPTMIVHSYALSLAASAGS